MSRCHSPHPFLDKLRLEKFRKTAQHPHSKAYMRRVLRMTKLFDEGEIDQIIQFKFTSKKVMEVKTIGS